MDKESFIVLLQLLGIFILIFSFMFGIVCIFNWIASCNIASVYNKLNNTNFTCSDFFWASDQINLQTQTIKLDIK